MNEKWKTGLFVIFAVIEAALLLFFIISAVMLFMEKNTDLFLMVASLSVFPAVSLAISIAEIIRIRKSRRNVFINSLLMKFTAFLFSFTIMYATPFFKEVRAASMLFGMMTMVMFGITFLFCKRPADTHAVYHPYPAKRMQFESYKSKWAWDDAAKEYMQKKQIRLEDLTKEDNEKIYDYASMPAVYFLDWLIKNHYLSEEVQDEESGVSFMQDMDYVLLRDDIKDTVLPFVDTYFDQNFRSHYNLYTLTYIYDYYQAIQNENRFYYCIDYSEEISRKITDTIDKQYRYYQSLYNSEYPEPANKTIRWQIARKDLTVSTIGNVSDAYIKTCEESLNSIPEEEKDRLVRMLKEVLSYGDSYEKMTFESFVEGSTLDEILIFEPEGEDPVYVILTENSIEMEHGLSIGFRNGHALYINYRSDYENPWDPNWKDIYDLSFHNADIITIHDKTDAERLVNERKLVVTEVNGEQIYTTRAALQMMQKISFCTEALIAYGYHFTKEWHVRYHADNPVPKELYFKAFYKDDTVFSQTIPVWC